MTKQQEKYSYTSDTDSVYGLMLVWKRVVDSRIDNADITTCPCDEVYIKNLVSDLILLADEYAVDFDKIYKQIKDDENDVDKRTAMYYDNDGKNI